MNRRHAIPSGPMLLSDAVIGDELVLHRPNRNSFVLFTVERGRLVTLASHTNVVDAWLAVDDYDLNGSPSPQDAGVVPAWPDPPRAVVREAGSVTRLRSVPRIRS
jgi:hypothetical protein